MIQCAVYTLLFFIQNLCLFWEAISHKTHNYQWRWDCQIFVNEEKKLVKPWDQTIASRLTVRYNHLGSWLILNVYRHEHTHQVSTLHISRSSDLTVHRASCCDETPSSFWQEFAAVSLFHCTVFTPKAWATSSVTAPDTAAPAACGSSCGWQIVTPMHWFLGLYGIGIQALQLFELIMI